MGSIPRFASILVDCCLTTNNYGLYAHMFKQNLCLTTHNYRPYTQVFKHIS